MRAPTWFAPTKRGWLLLFQTAVWVLFTFSFLRPPPEVAGNVGDAAALARLAGAGVVLLVITASALWSSKRHVWRWFSASAVLLAVAVLLQVMYASQRERRTCQSGDQRFVTGTALTPQALKHAAELSITDCAALLDEFAGVRSDVWSATSIGESALVLLWSYVASMALFGAGAIAAAHVVAIALFSVNGVEQRETTSRRESIPTQTSTQAASETVRDAQNGELQMSNGSLSTRVRRALVAHFSLDEIRTLCADLNVDYENLPGEGKEGKARALVEYVARRQGTEALLAAIREQRGSVI